MAWSLDRRDAIVAVLAQLELEPRKQLVVGGAAEAKLIAASGDVGGCRRFWHPPNDQ
jgi:hypothetical protein